LRTIEHPSPQEWSFFGNTVTGARDLDGDGWPDIVAAAPDQTIGSLVFTGQVYVINGRSGALIRSLTSPGAQRDGMFGYALAVRDQNRDPSGPDILIGARDESSTAQYQGRAYLFRGSDGALLRVLDRPTPQTSAHFGEAVADAGDLDGDGISDLLIGSPGEYMFNNPSPQGTVFVFSSVSGIVLHEFRQPNPQPTSSYGRAVAAIGDTNRDGRPEIVVGAPYWTLDNSNPIDGAAYLFTSRPRVSWWCDWFPWMCSLCDSIPWICSASG
jgi:hypothetical protein